MTGPSGMIEKTVTIDVPPRIEERARDQAAPGECVEKYLLDELEIDIEWRFKSKD